MDPHDLFNRKLSEFAAAVKPLVGHLPEYALLVSSIKWLTQFEPHRNQHLFDQVVASLYEERIIAKDEAFFLSPGSLDYHQSPGLVDLLRSVWTSSLTDADKQAVWAHLQVLVVLNRRCKAASGAAAAAAGSSK